MTLPSTGAISFSQVNAELYRSGAAALSLNDALLRKVAAVGGTGAQTTSGTPVSLSQLRGHAYGEYQITAATNGVNVTTYLSSVSRYAAGKTYGVVSIGSGVDVGSSSSAAPAVTLQGAYGDAFVIQNAGAIAGAGGTGGRGSNAGAYNPTSGSSGGAALSIQNSTSAAFVTVNNTGSISGGGGGGGGGNSYQDQQQSTPTPMSGPGGGGGAGIVGGTAGQRGTGFGTPSAAQGGTTTTGGQGGNIYSRVGYIYGGAGGARGQAGASGTGGGAGGAAGNAVVGVSFVTGTIGGTVLGPQA
jgi:hypothetical protein